MRRFFSIAVALIPFLFLGDPTTSTQALSPQSSALTPNSSDPLVLHLYFRDRAERDRLATEWGAEEVSTTGGYLTVIGDAGTLDTMRARGHRVDIDEKGTRELQNLPRQFEALGSSNPKPLIPFPNAQAEPLTFYGGYATMAGIYAGLDRMATQYPTLVEKVDIGDSWCKAHPGACIRPTPHSGSDLWVMRVTNRAIPGPKPVFWFDTGIHSREIATPEMSMRFLQLLLDGYATDPDVHWLVDHHDIWVMPLLNPDGRRIVEAGDEGFPFSHRKNADNDDGCQFYPPTSATQFGTDLNRNFPFKWACCDGSSSIACREAYRGPSESSEEETQAVVAKIRQLIPDQRGPRDADAAPLLATGIHQNMHAYADLNLYPWGWTTAPAPNSADLENIAAHVSARDAGGNGYDYCQPTDCLYATDGTADDWAYGELGIAAITTELSGDTFFPDFAVIEGIWNDNRGMLLYMAKIARAPYLLTRGPDAEVAGGRQVTAARGSIAQVAATINYSWTGNSYKQNVAAAELYLDTPPWAGGVPIPMLPTDGAFNSPTESVAANVDTAGLTPGRHILYTRGRGAQSYEGNQSWGPVGAAWLDVSPAGTDPTPGAEGSTASSLRGGRPGR